MDVDMRIGVIAGDHGRMTHDVVVDIGVHVEGYADRRDGIDGTDAPQQFALTVFMRSGDHRAMQIEQDAVPAALAHGGQDGRHDLLIGVVFNRAARVGIAGDRHLQFGTLGLRKLDETGQGAAGAAMRRNGRIAHQHRRAITEEALDRRGHRGKGIGLVLEHCGKQAQGTHRRFSRRQLNAPV